MINWFRRSLVTSELFLFVILLILCIFDSMILNAVLSAPATIRFFFSLVLAFGWGALLRRYKNKWSRIYAAQLFNNNV